MTGIVGLLVVGRLADRLALRDPRWLPGIVAVLTAVLIPCSALAFIVEHRVASTWFIALSYVIGTAYMAPSIAALQRLVRPDQRATASAIFLFFGATIGSLGPFLTGLLSDRLKDGLGAESLGWALLLVVPAFQVVAVLLYVLATQWFKTEALEVADSVA